MEEVCNVHYEQYLIERTKGEFPDWKTVSTSDTKKEAIEIAKMWNKQFGHRVRASREVVKRYIEWES